LATYVRDLFRDDRRCLVGFIPPDRGLARRSRRKPGAFGWPVRGAAEVEQFVKDTIAPMTTRAQVTTTVNSGVINTKALVPVEDLVAVGMFNFLNGYNIAVQSNHYVEW
jgi:hypothetical protein